MRRFNSMLVSSFLSASVALAVPSQCHRQSQTPVNASSEYLSNWAGTRFELENGSFQFITSIVTVPDHVSGPTNSGVTMMIAIDGTSCSGFLAAGIDAMVIPNGTSYQAWYQSGNATTRVDFDMTISGGDLIQLTLNALDETTGLVFVENLSHIQVDHARVHFDDSLESLCERSAGWVVQRLRSANGTWLPLSDFEVAFAMPIAAGRGGTDFYHAQDANTTEILNNDGSCATSVNLNFDTEGGIIIQRV